MRTQNLHMQIRSLDRGYLTLFENNSRKTIEIDDYMVFGRDPAAQIQLSDPFISQRHARVEKRGDGYYIRDLRSRNGTFVNGSRILEAKLQDHDRICIGTIELLFSAEKDFGMSSTHITSLNRLWNQQLQRLPAFAQSPHPVLISGPSGTGKEMLAQMIHRLSARAHKTYLSVNCSALTETLAESELFGHVKGSFTGAQESRKGAFESAREGTLFLDEIGDMPLNIQPKFLRALENHEIKPVGSDTTLPTDVRIVAATNKDLQQLVKEGRFREDLYYRLHILQVRTPALCNRLEDFDILLKNFAQPLKVTFSFSALAALKKYSWPGNIRELKNVVHRAAALYPSIPIGPEELHTLVDSAQNPSEWKMERKSFHPARARKYLKEYEKEAIIERLILNNGNQRRTAEELGIAKSTLNDRIRRYNIDIKNLVVFKG